MPIERHILARRGLFVGANLCAAIAVHLVAIGPAVSLLADQADRLAQARALLARYRAIVGQEAAVRRNSAHVVDEVSSVAFLQGTSDGAVSAGLQARLKGLADHAGARVQSVRAIEPKTFNSIRYLGAHVELAGTIAAVYATLRAIEDREPYLFVDAATLRMPAAPSGQTLPQEPPIDAQFDIYGPVRSHAVGH